MAEYVYYKLYLFKKELPIILPPWLGRWFYHDLGLAVKVEGYDES
jgi:hypothetical protein